MGACLKCRPLFSSLILLDSAWKTSAAEDSQIAFRKDFVMAGNRKVDQLSQHVFHFLCSVPSENYCSSRECCIDSLLTVILFPCFRNFQNFWLERKPEGKVEEKGHGVEICAEDPDKSSSDHFLRAPWVSLLCDNVFVTPFF